MKSVLDALRGAVLGDERLLAIADEVAAVVEALRRESPDLGR